MTTIEGGCLCGAVRYGTDAAPTSSVHCHCKMCRQASGAPVVTWISVPRSSFRFTQGAPVTYPSSPGAERIFCGRCGSPMVFQTDRYPDELDINVGTLDRPEDVPPSHHIWTSSRIGWLHLDESLPSHAAFSPQD